MQWCGVLTVLLLASGAILTSAASIQPAAQDDHRAKRSEEMVMFGNHQNLPKVKKADPNMSPLSGKQEDNTEDEEEQERKQAVEKIFAEDEEAEKSKQAIDKMFALHQAPIAEDMHEDNDVNNEESSGEGDENSLEPENYYYNFNDYYYPDVESKEMQEWLRANKARDASREERSVDGREKRSAIVAEDMMGGIRAARHADRRLKRDLTEEQIRELLEAGSYDGDEYLNYPSFNILNPEDRSPYNEDLDYNPSAMDYQYLEEVMDNALLEADEAEREEQERLEEAEAEREYEEYLEQEKELEEREEVQKALGLLRIMYENIPDGDEPVYGQREEVGPGYRVEETWEKYLPSGASIDQESVLTDYRPIVFEGEEGIFIPMPQQEKRSVPWGTLSAMPGMKKRGYVGFADVDKREAKRNSDEYGRLFRLARALRGDNVENF